VGGGWGGGGGGGGGPPPLFSFLFPLEADLGEIKRRRLQRPAAHRCSPFPPPPFAHARKRGKEKKKEGRRLEGPFPSPAPERGKEGCLRGEEGNFSPLLTASRMVAKQNQNN